MKLVFSTGSIYLYGAVNPGRHRGTVGTSVRHAGVPSRYSRRIGVEHGIQPKSDGARRRVMWNRARHRDTRRSVHAIHSTARNDLPVIPMHGPFANVPERPPDQHALRRESVHLVEAVATDDHTVVT